MRKSFFLYLTWLTDFKIKYNKDILKWLNFSPNPIMVIFLV